MVVPFEDGPSGPPAIRGRLFCRTRPERTREIHSNPQPLLKAANSDVLSRSAGPFDSSLAVLGVAQGRLRTSEAQPRGSVRAGPGPSVTNGLQNAAASTRSSVR